MRTFIIDACRGHYVWRECHAQSRMSPLSPMHIPTTLQNIVLRPWSSNDYSSLVQYGNNKRVWRNLSDMFPHPYTHQHAVEWVEFSANASASIHLAIDLEGEAIGGAGVIAGEGMEFHTGKFGYWLGEPHWGRGVATASARALKEYAFSFPRFKRLEAPVLAWNPASMQVLEKIGFNREGVLQSSAFKDGELIDQVMYAVINNGQDVI
jgi:[ribosomal protein S5]-alanine N-acetyltransferase